MALVIVGSLLLSGRHDAKPAADAPAATATPCVALKQPYGLAPDGFAYDRAPEAQRRRTVKALNLDESGGKVDMRLARRGGITLGSIVGVPSADPGAYVGRLTTTAESGGAQVTHSRGYVMIPLANGTDVAVGAKGCRAVLIASQDPNGLRYLAAAIFGE